MEQFVYSDIFDTKGIEYIIVIAFLVLIIPFWMLLNRPVKMKEVSSALQSITLQALRIPQGLFFNRNHTWSHMEPSGVARVGVDDLLLHLTGGVELEYLKERQERVRRGEPIARISQEGKELVITSPISGEIDRVHSSLEKESSLIGKDPYSAWLYRIRPEKWQEETRDAMMAGQASEWVGRELDRVKDYMAGAVSGPHGTEVILQEGGELSGHPLMELDREAWIGFQEKFLNMEG